jgi:hypothetical protein
MRKAIALSTALIMGAALAAPAEAGRFRGGNFHRHRTVIIEQQPTLGIGLGLGVGLLGLLAAQQTFAQPAEVYEPAPRRLSREPKLRDNPVPLK